MADKFSIEAKLKITGVDVKGDLNAGTLKFKVDTSALKKLVSDAGEAAKRVKAKFDRIKLKKLKVEVNQTSLRTIESQIRKSVQSAVSKTKVKLQTSVGGGTKGDPFKAQRQAARLSAKSLASLNLATKQASQSLRSIVKAAGSITQKGAGVQKGSLPLPAGARTVSVGAFGGGGGGGGGRPGPAASPGGFGRGGGGVKQLSAGLRDVTSATKDANNQMLSLADLTEQVGRKAAAFRGVAIAINTMVTAAQDAAKFMVEFTDSLLEVNKILQLSDRTLQKLGDDLFALSAKTGVAVDQTIRISETFSRAGLAGRGYGTIVELTDRALTGLQGTTLDAAQASELFIQIIQQVEGGVRGLNKELVTTAKLFDVLGKAEDITASKATDVQAAFKRSAASIFATGVSIEQATAIISVLQERTQRGGDVIGTALKTLAARTSNSASEASKALKSIGVETIDAQGNLRNLFDVLQDAAVAFQGLTESEQANIAVKAAGIRQVEIFRAALQNFSRLQDVNNQLVNASGDAARKQAVEQKKLGVQLEKIKISLQELIKTASEGVIGEAFVGAIKLTKGLLDGINAVDKAVGGAVTTFGGFLAAGLALKVLLPMMVGLKRAIAFFIGAQKDAAVAMGGIQKGAASVATTVTGQLNTSMQRTATTIGQATIQMNGLMAATTATANQASRLSQVSLGAASRGNQDIVGGSIIAGGRPGGADQQAFNKLGFGKVIGGVEQKISRFGVATSKVTSTITKGFSKLSNMSIGLAAVFSIAGGAAQSLADSLRKSGQAGLGTAVDVGGGALGGLGTGALIGSLAGGPVGTAVGAIVGLIGGSLQPLIRAFSDVGDSVEALEQKYLALGIIQTENGEITSEVAQKLDKALRNLRAFKGFEASLQGPGAEAPDAERVAKIEKSRVDATQGLRASFDRSASDQAKATQVLEALTRSFQARTGQKDIDLAAPELLNQAAPVLATFGEATLREIQKEAQALAEEFGVSADVVKSIFDTAIADVKNQQPQTGRLGGGIAGVSVTLDEASIGQALANILGQLGPVLAPAVEKDVGEKQRQADVRAAKEVADIIASVRSESPLQGIGRFIDRPVNKLSTILRGFIADFGREVIKLNEAQLRATTPQIKLAEALASNARANVGFTQRRAALEKSDAIQTARVQFEAISGKGEITREGSTRTTGDALSELFDTLLQANRQIASEGIVDPDKQRAITSKALTGIDLQGVSEKQIKAVVDGVKKLSKTFIKLDTEAMQAVIKSNKAALNALKARLSEEARSLTVDRRRREAAALNARGVVEELTGIRRLVAERKIEASLVNGNIGAQQSRIATLDEELAKLNAVEQTEQNRVGVLDQIQELERRRTNESITLENQLFDQRNAAIRDALQVAKMAVAAGKKAGNIERTRIGALSDINNLLSVNRSAMQEFNDELATVGAQFRASQAELAGEAQIARGISDPAEREAQLNNIRQRGAALALEQAKAEAQVIAKRREAIQQISQELLGNQQEQVDAQRAVIDATKSLSDVFEGYLQAVDGAILATTQYTLGLELAEVEAKRVTGSFTGIREELSVVADTFRDAENLARQMGASEATLVEIRRESINQQLSLFNDLLSQQSQLARTFFTSAAQDQADLFTGIQEAQGIASLLGGTFEDFKKKGEGAINKLGAQLLALPQQTRQRVVSSLETLSAVGGEVGGFTADQLLTAIETASLGVSGEGLEVDPLFEVQSRIAQLVEEQARLSTEELIAANEGVQAAKEQLEIAQAAKDLAEIQLERIQEEGDKLRGKLGELQGQLNTTLLQQEQTARLGFQSVTSAVARAANDVITQLPDAFSIKVAEAMREVLREGGVSAAGARGLPVSDSQATPPTRGKIAADAIREGGRNRAINQQQFGAGGPATRNLLLDSQVAPAGGGTNDPSDTAVTSARRLDDILTELKTLNTSSDANLSATEEIRDSSGNTLGTASATVAGGATEITVNVEGTSTVTVTGFEAGVTRISQALSETFGGFATEEEARKIANEVLENIRTELLRRGIITPTTL